LYKSFTSSSSEILVFKATGSSPEPATATAGESSLEDCAESGIVAEETLSPDDDERAGMMMLLLLLLLLFVVAEELSEGLDSENADGFVNECCLPNEGDE
jgi:hypothetical protein